MSVQLNHTIVWCRDKQRSATFLAEILGMPAPTRFEPFLVVALSNGVSLDFHETDGEIASQHYAFLVREEEFDQVFGRIRARGLEYWADPGQRSAGTINTNDGGRGVLLRGPGRPSARSHHAALRQRGIAIRWSVTVTSRNFRYGGSGSEQLAEIRCRLFIS